MMSTHGWRGVHALNAIAHGRGPQTFGALVPQEFQWSRSLCTILLKCTPLYFGKLPLRLKLQFGFCQLWYPLFSLLMLVMYLLPLGALLLDSNMVAVNYPDFFFRITFLWIILTGMAFWWRKQQWLRPVDVKMPNWEGTLFLFARWPWSLIERLRCERLDREIYFGVSCDPMCAAAEPLPFRILAPYAFLSVASGLPPVLLIGHVKIAVGFYLFAAMNSLLYATLLLVIIIMHRRENPAPSLCSDRLSSVIEPLLGSISTAPVRAPVAMACHRTSRKREEELVN
jgi:hypothetical protein